MRFLSILIYSLPLQVSHSTRVFTKVIAVVEAYLWRMGEKFIRTSIIIQLTLTLSTNSRQVYTLLMDTQSIDPAGQCKKSPN